MTRVSPQSPSQNQQPPSTAELIERLSQFDGPPEHFLVNLLAVQCYVTAAENGSILRVNPTGTTEVLAVHPALPQGASAPVWLTRAVESAPGVIAGGKTALKPLHDQADLYGQPARRHLVMIPLRTGGGFAGLGAFVVESADNATLIACRERLELTISLLSIYEMRLALSKRQGDLKRLKLAMDILAAVNEHDRFTGAAMALCNELASRFASDRVGLGFLKGRYVHLRALSHTEKFSRKMKLVQDIEAAQEECLDQDVEVLHPTPEGATFVARSAKELSVRHGPTAILCLPLRREGKPMAVMSLERPLDKPFAAEEVESIRLICELVTPRLANLHEHDRWVGARLAAGLRKGAALAVGPKHTWIKLLALGGCAFVLFLCLARGQYRADAKFVLEATRVHLLAAPFDGTVEQAELKPGDAIEAGKTVLALMDTRELNKELFALQSQEFAYRKQADKARTEGKIGDAQVAEAQRQAVAARIDLLNSRLEKARILSPVSGVLTKGDLEKQHRPPVKQGDILFEVAPLDTLRAELSVDEEDIAEIRAGMEGELATATYPDRKVGFVVERINPVAEVVEQQNIFKVRVRLKDKPDWMRPGMEGVAKIDVDRRLYASIWTRKLVNWIRMKLWW
ncbi:MAG: macrolide transporter subunit MacA [Planctomycetes bacterium ADurb.Bin126]|nr:MAG: macrolide transporter subunit MacA [Planctomycetes bacterium ADurb.Bin126]HQL73267.1 HlyD family efflux transporter periplasmic adaptor subunit [Phycisphaerae bacterium]